MDRRSPMARGVLFVIACALAGHGAVALAEEAVVSPLEREMVGVRKLIQSAHAKLRRNLIGPSEDEGDDGQPETPVRLCCASNLQRLVQRMSELQRQLVLRGECYEREGDYAMISAAEFTKIDLQNLGQALDRFVNAPVRQQALSEMDGVTRAYLALRKSVDELRPCGDPADAGRRSESGGRKDKKKNRTKGDEQD